MRNYSLGPAGFQDVMAQTTSSIFAMDSYAKLIQNQQETDLSKISSINSEFREYDSASKRCKNECGVLVK